MKEATRSTNTPPPNNGVPVRKASASASPELENGNHLCTRVINRTENEKDPRIVDLLPDDRNARLGTGEKNAYTLFDAQRQSDSITQMMDVLERQDVVFIGEIHNCPIAHWMGTKSSKTSTTGTATG